MLTLWLASTAAVLAIWVGYPLAVALIARWCRRPAASPWPAPPAVSAVVATRDLPELVAARVLDLFAADYAGRLEVVVTVDADAADGLLVDVGLAVRELAVAANRAVLVVAGDAPGGKAAALNAGVRASRGEIVVFTDTGQRFAPATVRLLIAELAHRRFAAVSGALDIPTTGGPLTLAERYWRYEKWLRANEACVHSTVGVTGAVWAMRRALWAPVPAGLILDDVFTPMRLVLDGHRVGFAPAARATDTRRFGTEQEYRRKVRTLTGVIQLCAWLPAVLVPRRNPVWAQFLFHKLLRLATPWLVLGGVAGFAGVVVERGRDLLGGRGAALALVLVAAATVVVALLPGPGARVRRQLQWGLSLQAAILVATFHGLRGRWNVWQR